ncbi:MAG: AraC family transcriptional regulator [Clostridia bacterium]|nr:AraC family transcriptional regulator [Clostridia bacterium]
MLHLPSLLTCEDFDALHHGYAAVQERQEGSSAQLNALLWLFLLRILKAQHAAAPTCSVSIKERAVIDKLFAYLDAHLSESVRVEDLCAELRVSQSYLYRCSRDVMNCSTNQIIVRYKMRHAQTLLKNPDLTISEVAAAVGYDPYYFSSQFKKHFLLSPSVYRKSLR